MKTSISILAVGLLLSPAMAQTPPAAEAPVFQSLKLIHGEEPVFPHDLVTLGVREGEVRVAFSVDAQGNVDDCLAVMYTHPEFAELSVDAIKRWKFDPARFHGQPIAAASEVTVTFEVQGTVVVSLSPSETVSTRLYSLLKRPFVYRPSTLKELDRIPTPIAAPAPIFPTSVAARVGYQQVTVDFYIDETGMVRLPSINATDDPELGAIAINALRNWKFEPPTCKGRPVLVRASQLFNFHPEVKPATASAAPQTPAVAANSQSN